MIDIKVNEVNCIDDEEEYIDDKDYETDYDMEEDDSEYNPDGEGYELTNCSRL